MCIVFSEIWDMRYAQVPNTDFRIYQVARRNSSNPRTLTMTFDLRVLIDEVTTVSCLPGLSQFC